MKKILDLFCRAGGSAYGYHLAGFEVTGVDIVPQPDFPFKFIQKDLTESLANKFNFDDYDAIHASPPCQYYTWGTRSDRQSLTKSCV